jgi:Transcriptional regulator PadR-like family
MQYIGAKLFERELKKGSTELLILSLIEHRPRHGYEISKLIEKRSGGLLTFNVASSIHCSIDLKSGASSQGDGSKRRDSVDGVTISSLPKERRY